MKFYHDWSEWLARDENGELWAYAEKPLKGFDGFVASCGRCENVKETDDTFKLIRWEDEEPTKIKRGLETGGVSVAELSGIMNAKAHGYDEVLTMKKSKVYSGKTMPENAIKNDIWFENRTIDGKQVTIVNRHNGTTFEPIFSPDTTIIAEPIGSVVADMVNQPNHYIGIQGLEVETVLQNFIPRYTNSYEAHRIASAIEYLLRSPLKNGTEDVKKAKKNIEQVLSYRETQNE